MILAAASLAAFAATASADTDRLAYGTSWHCEAGGSADRYGLDFAIGHSEPGKPEKKLTVTRTVGDVPEGIAGYSSLGADKNAFFNPREAAKAESYPYAEFTHGFYNYGVSVTAMWWSKKPGIELYVTTFDFEHRADPEKRNQKYFALRCNQPVAAK